MAAPATERTQAPRIPRASSEKTNRAVVGSATAALVAAPSRGGRQIAILDGSASAVAQERRRRSLGWLWFVIVVVLPAALAGAYYYLFAADQYVAEFRFALRSAEPERRDPVLFFQESVASSPIGLDSYVVVQYLASRAIVDDLSRTLDLREMFSRSEADWLARLDLPVSIEEMVRYWKGQVDAFFDATNGTIVVKARAFTQQDALKLAEGILASSERLVNELRPGLAAIRCAMRRARWLGPNSVSKLH